MVSGCESALIHESGIVCGGYVCLEEEYKIILDPWTGS